MDIGPGGGRTGQYVGAGIDVSIAIRAGLGLLLNNLALGIAVGSGIGCAFLAHRDEEDG